MARVLAATVNLTDDEGTVTTWRAGSTPPPDVAEKITNPSAWAEEEPDDEPAQIPAPPAPPTPPPAPPPPEQPTSSSDGGGLEPARNASTEVWRSFAEGLGQTVEPEIGRDAIIAQLAAAGLIQE